MKLGTQKEVEERERLAKKNKKGKEPKQVEEPTPDWIVDPSKKKKKESKKKESTDDGDKKGKGSTIVLIIAALLAILLGGVAFLFLKNKSAQPVDEGPVEVEDTSVPSEEILNTINSMYQKGAMIGVDIDPDEDFSIIYYFDANGKAYAESPYINGLYIDKNKSLTEKQDGNGEYYFSIVDDMTPLYLAETIVNVANGGKGTITNVTTEEEKADGCKTYQVDIQSTDIADVFSVVSDTYCNEQIKMLYDVLNKSELPLNNKLRLLITIGKEDGQVAAAVFVVREDTPYILYSFEGYTSIGGWTLDDSIWNANMDASDYKKLREKYQSVQTFCGAQIEKWLTDHPEVLEQLGNRAENNRSNSSSKESQSVESETSAESK